MKSTHVEILVVVAFLLGVLMAATGLDIVFIRPAINTGAMLYNGQNYHVIPWDGDNP